MAKKLSVREMWESFRTCVPANASSPQVHDMRMAFYAGAWAVFNAVVNSLEPGEEPTEADLNLMDTLHKELETGIAEFVKSQGQS